jgi:hypothetical protein
VLIFFLLTIVCTQIRNETNEINNEMKFRQWLIELRVMCDEFMRKKVIYASRKNSAGGKASSSPYLQVDPRDAMES